jgi:hypothetical protein
MPDTVREPEAFATEAMDPVEAHHEELQPDPMIGRTPSFVPVVSEESPAPFVTETMAELYLQQGFRTEALSVYRQLLARNPGDPQLTARVQALESGAEWSIAPDEAAPPPTPASESARAFFARFATREPTRRVTGSAAAEADTSPAPAFPLGGAALPDEALTTPDAPALTQIFSGQQEDPADTRAASALASAFDPSPAPGGELSLERLFRDVPARSSSAVTLTEEESATLAEPGGGAPPPAESPDETPADYEQFTAWLEGLKKK